jgi:TonB family protein
MCAQSHSANSNDLPYKEVVLAKTSFIDIGPPFDFYSVYKLIATDNGTDIEKVAVTPAAGSCQPPTIDATRAHLQTPLAELFANKNLCAISEIDLHREAKRCKHCLVFSGVHVTAQLECKGATRSIKYEVLDRDIFDPNARTPPETSQTMKLLSILDEAFGGGDLDRPVFQTAQTQSHTPERSETLKEVEQGKYDGLFSESLSKLYRDSLKIPKLPLVSLNSSTPLVPISPVMPAYPPIARAAHQGGEAVIELQVGPEGKVSNAKWVSGSPLFESSATTALKQWIFPTEAVGKTQTVTLGFNLYCAQPVTNTSNSQLQLQSGSATSVIPVAH